MHNENFKLEATEYVREHGYVKGAPNLAGFAHWVLETWDVQVHEETAQAWFHQFNKKVTSGKMLLSTEENIL